MLKGVLEVIVRHVDHGDTLPTGYNRVPGPKSYPDRVVSSTRQGKPVGYLGSKRTGGTLCRHVTTKHSVITVKNVRYEYKCRRLKDLLLVPGIVPAFKKASGKLYGVMPPFHRISIKTSSASRD